MQANTSKYALIFVIFLLKAASVAFSYRGKIWWSKHAGRLNFSDVNSPLPNDDTPYPVASITKLFTVRDTYNLH